MVRKPWFRRSMGGPRRAMGESYSTKGPPWSMKGQTPRDPMRRKFSYRGLLHPVREKSILIAQ